MAKIEYNKNLLAFHPRRKASLTFPMDKELKRVKSVYSIKGDIMHPKIRKFELPVVLENTQQQNTKIVENLYSLGMQQASYLTGFATAFDVMEFPKEMIKDIVIAKMQLEYQQEMNRMRLETEERIADNANTLLLNNFGEEE